MKNIKLIIDFDSTFIKAESLDELFSLSLKEDSEKDLKVAKIQEITKLGMEGKIHFRDSLLQRVSLLKAGKKEVEEVGESLRNQLSPSVIKNKDFFLNNSGNIFIVSGGFKEIIWKVVHDFGIKSSHILANDFTYDQSGQIIGFDLDNPCSQSGGKSLAVLSLELTGKVIVIGDGMTDYQIKQQGAADIFIAFTENVSRSEVIKNADFTAKDFDQVMALLNY